MRIEFDHAFERRAADRHVGSVPDHRQGLRVRTLAGAVATRGNFQAQRLVRPLGVVHLTPGVERLLRIEQVTEAAVTQDLGRQRALRNGTATCHPSSDSPQTDGTTHSRWLPPPLPTPQTPHAETLQTHLSKP